ncbi:MAG: YhcB family protein [Gammaproteobacteria bacterium]
MEPVAIVGICIVVLIVGYLLGLAVGKSGATKQSNEVEEARAELKQYREEVSEHFGKTATHFQALGQNYRELYDHMASGADALFEQGDGDKAVAFVPMEQLLAADKPPTDVTPAAAEPAAEPDTSSAQADTEPAVEEPVAAPVEEATEAIVADAADDAVQASDAFAEEPIEDISAAQDTLQAENQEHDDQPEKTNA